MDHVDGSMGNVLATGDTLLSNNQRTTYVHTAPSTVAAIALL